MAQNQPSGAITVILSDTLNIPAPGIITDGTNTSGVATTLTDAGQDFLNSTTNANGYNITGGDVVVSAAGVICEIASVDSATQLTLLFVGTGGPASTLKITTVAGQDVTLVNIPDSSFIPIQVQRVWAGGTTCSDIIALQ